MFFRQLFDPASSTLSYLIADDTAHEAVIIDPVAEQVERDHDRDNFLWADAAQEYGIIDKVLQNRVSGG